MVILFFLFSISDNVSDIDSEKSVYDESNVPDFNTIRESETSTVPTKTAEDKTGNFLYDVLIYLG